MYYYNVEYTEKMTDLWFWRLVQFNSPSPEMTSAELRALAIEKAQELTGKDNFRNVHVREVLPGTRCAPVVWPENYEGRKRT